MIPDNSYYGHAEILRQFCGIQRPLPIPYGLQHGWTPGAGFSQLAAQGWWDKLIWSRRNLDECKRLGYRNVRAIGAPFVYLSGPWQDHPRMGESSLLVVPFHGWEKQRLADNLEAYACSLESLSREGFEPITICLHWSEYQDSGCRGVFEARGWRVVTNGPRNNNPEFLAHQKELILNHAYVTSNRVSTIAFHALICNRPYFFYGPTMGLHNSADPSGKLFDQWQKREFPMLAYEKFQGDVYRALGEAELGLEFKLPPGDMIELFGWGYGGSVVRIRARMKRFIWRIRKRLKITQRDM